MTTANPTPKTRFQEIKGAIDAHHTLIDTESFKRGCDFAVMEYQRKCAVQQGLAIEANPQTSQVIALGNSYKLQGIQEFLSELRNLAERPVVSEKPGLARVLDHAN